MKAANGAVRRRKRPSLEIRHDPPEDGNLSSIPLAFRRPNNRRANGTAGEQIRISSSPVSVAGTASPIPLDLHLREIGSRTTYIGPLTQWRLKLANHESKSKI